MDLFTIKQNDTAPDLQATLLDGAGVAANVTGATVVFSMRAKDGTVKVTRGACTLVDAANGVVKYPWIAADTDTVGSFEGEFEVTYSGGKVQTFPNTGHIPIQITDDIA